MPLDAVEAEAILRARGLWKEEPASKSAPPPNPAPPPPVKMQEGYQPGVGLIINIPGREGERSPFPPGTKFNSRGEPYNLEDAPGQQISAAQVTPERMRALAAANAAPAAITVPPPDTSMMPSTAPAPVPPAAAPGAAPGAAPTAAPTAPPPSGLDATVERAKSVIGGMESGNRYDIVHPPARNGEVALGRYGILASGLAKDSRRWYGQVVSQEQFLKNPSIQDKIFEGRFGDLVQKYGVEGAARAWFAGEGGMNRDDASDGNTTVANYASQFMQRFSGGEPTATTARAPGGGLTPEQANAILTQRGIAATPSDVPEKSVFDRVKDRVVDLATTYAQFEAGVMKGAAGVALAPIQTVSEMTGDWYKPMEARVAELEEALDKQTGGKGTWADVTGRVVGSVAAIVAGSRALGPLAAPLATRIVPQIAQNAWVAIGAVPRSVLTAAPLAATTYYPAGSENEKRFGLEHLAPARVIDAVMFGALGPIGGVVSRGATWIAENLSKMTAEARTTASDAGSAASDALLKASGPRVQELFNQVLQRTAGSMSRNSERPLANTVANYRRLERENSQKFAVRNAAGQEFEGFQSGVVPGSQGLKQALGEGAEATAEEGVRQSSKAGAARQAAREELGLPAEEARYKSWQVRQTEYEQRMASWLEQQAANPYAGPNYMRQLEAQGGVPRPVPPPPFEPTPVTAAQWSAARTALNKAWGRAKGDAADQTQIKQMINGLDRVAEGEAASYGLPVAEFVRKAEIARAFYEKNIAPLRYGLFGGKTSAQLAGREGVPFSGMTPTEFHELVMKPVRANNLERVRDLKQVLGPQSQHDMAAMVASDMLLLSDQQARKFVSSRGAVLLELLGREEYTQLQGLATIAEHIQKFKPMTLLAEKGEKEPATNFVSNLLEGGSGTRIGKWMAFYQVGKAMFGVGDRAQHLKEAGLYFFGPPMAHLAYNIVTTMHQMPVLRPLVARARHMEPGSKELDNYLVGIERRIRGVTNSTLRGASEAVDQQ